LTFFKFLFFAVECYATSVKNVFVIGIRKEKVKAALFPSWFVNLVHENFLKKKFLLYYNPTNKINFVFKTIDLFYLNFSLLPLHSIQTQSETPPIL